ncbi:MAG: VCBS repeat-containing protein [Alphaproteobacteria bacterium]|nr:VCBS repeat-containing protein [Alphaproteobacteria bacterium]
MRSSSLLLVALAACEAASGGSSVGASSPTVPTGSRLVIGGTPTCSGDPSTGDYDADGTCDDLDPPVCDAMGATADRDGDGTVDACDVCLEHAADDTNGDDACDGPGLRGSDSWATDASYDGVMVLTRSLEPVDVDQDGHTDLVVSQNNPRTVHVFYGDGTGAFPRHTELTSSGKLSAAVVADVDGDGDNDVIATAVYTPGIEWWQNTGSGFTHQARFGTATSGQALDLAVADIDADGDNDLVVARGPDGVELYRWDAGAGQWGAVESLPGLSDDARGVALTDVDGDGDLDLVTGWLTGSLTIQTNDSAGTFSATTTIATGIGSDPGHLATPDLDNDGDPDLVVGGFTRLGVWRNDLGGSLFVPLLDDGDGDTRFAAADLDDDGLVDLAFADGSTVWWRRQSASSFGPRQTIRVHDGITQLTAADLDEDGDLDVAAVDVGGTRLSVFFNPLGGVDADGDGWDAGSDCTDADVAVNPGATSCVDDVDRDCDGVCDTVDLCLGDDVTGDTDGDAVCDDRDVCTGDDATGDSDLDGVCDDRDACPLDDPDDADGDGYCDSDFLLDVGDVSPGRPVVLTVRNAPMGQVLFAVSHVGLSTTHGPCTSTMSGGTVCTDLSHPFLIAARQSGTTGEVTVTGRAPSALTVGSTVWFQAVSPVDGGDVTPVQMVTVF